MLRTFRQLLSLLTCQGLTRKGGLCLIYKVSFHAKIIDSAETDKFEMLAIELKLHSKPFLFIVVYHIPGTSSLELYNEFSEKVLALVLDYEEVICLGDFNLHFNTWKNSQIWSWNYFKHWLFSNWISVIIFWLGFTCRFRINQNTEIVLAHIAVLKECLWKMLLRKLKYHQQSRLELQMTRIIHVNGS